MSTTPSTSGEKRYRLLDLFCCSGIGAEGYAACGFEVVGVDIDPQPNYPFEFHQRDAIDVLRGWSDIDLNDFDAIHASPPCQHYSDLAKRNGNADDWPDLVRLVRLHLEADPRTPWVIENVEGAPLRDPVVLCGTMFPGLRVLRHRLFETNWPLAASTACTRSCSPTTSARRTTGSSTRTRHSCRSRVVATARWRTPVTPWACPTTTGVPSTN